MSSTAKDSIVDYVKEQCKKQQQGPKSAAEDNIQITQLTEKLIAKEKELVLEKRERQDAETKLKLLQKDFDSLKNQANQLLKFKLNRKKHKENTQRSANDVIPYISKFLTHSLPALNLGASSSSTMSRDSGSVFDLSEVSSVHSLNFNLNSSSTPTNGSVCDELETRFVPQSLSSTFDFTAVGGHNISGDSLLGCSKLSTSMSKIEMANELALKKLHELSL